MVVWASHRRCKSTYGARLDSGKDRSKLRDAKCLYNLVPQHPTYTAENNFEIAKTIQNYWQYNWQYTPIYTFENANTWQTYNIEKKSKQHDNTNNAQIHITIQMLINLQIRDGKPLQYTLTKRTTWQCQTPYTRKRSNQNNNKNIKHWNCKFATQTTDSDNWIAKPTQTRHTSLTQ